MDTATRELCELITQLCGQAETEVRSAAAAAQEKVTAAHSARGDLSNELVIDVANAMEQLMTAREKALVAALKKALVSRPVDSSPETLSEVLQFLTADLGLYFRAGSEQITKALGAIGYFDGTPPTLNDVQESVRFRMTTEVKTALAAMPAKVAPPPPPPPAPVPTPASVAGPAPALTPSLTTAPMPSRTIAPMPLRAVESKKPGYEARVYRVTIASPTETAGEREIVREAVNEWNAASSLTRKLALLPVSWDTDVAVVPGARSLVKDSDLLIAVFWTRMGAAAEEIREHLSAGKPAMIYFCTAAPTGAVDADQQAGLKSFRAQCKELGLVQLFADAGQFRELFTRQLAKQLDDTGKFPGLAAYQV